MVVLDLLIEIFFWFTELPYKFRKYQKQRLRKKNKKLQKKLDEKFAKYKTIY